MNPYRSIGGAMGGQPLTSLSQTVFAPAVGAMGAIPKGQPKGQPPAGGGEIHSREGSQGAIVSPLGSSLEHSSPDGPPY